MKALFQPEWRTQNRAKRRFYSKYMTWLERVGYLVVLCVVAAFLFAFNYPVDDLVSAEGVKLLPASSPIKASANTLIARTLVDNFAEVKAGQPVLEIVEGDEAIKAYDLWSKVDTLKASIRASEDVKNLAKKYPKPTTRIVLAPVAGTFRFDPKQLLIDAKKEIARVVDYNDVRISASLAGDTISKARAGQFARVSNIDLSAATGTIFRASSSSGPALSSQIFGEDLKKLASDSLKGRAVRVRDDVPLAIQEVSEVQVDAAVQKTAEGQGNPVPLDPPTNFVLRAMVLDGLPVATAQIADLPPDVEAQLRSKVESFIRGRQVRDLTGHVQSLDNPRNIHFLIKLKAEDAAQRSEGFVTGTPLKRSFDANLKIESPPAFLVNALRQADLDGKDITARVELRTGSRPIAFILLKKS